ncbi:hypothetical protein [Curtobacterium sp. MCSS17_007]|uniref:hypothetical protein n=1 Tax=Curtobacterium sp. MCSS17_007 TaxID=2175646 RepID=UPI000DA8C9CE|nr:hypothetical protein [Curtobacterium sp. MCSS17_007]WIE74469.1 hypothetical protein DEJ22_009255 [Curtobacterium sp. MCSS17_007]
MSEQMNQNGGEAEIERALYWIDEGIRAAEALARHLRMARSMTEELRERQLTENGAKNIEIMGSAMRVVTEHVERGSNGLTMFFKNSKRTGS